MGVYVYSPCLLDYEMFDVLLEETVMGVVCTVVAIFVLVLLFTASCTGASLAFISVMLTTLFTVGTLHILGLQFNAIVLVFIIVGMGSSANYSALLLYNCTIWSKQKSQIFEQH